MALVVALSSALFSACTGSVLGAPEDEQRQGAPGDAETGVSAPGDGGGPVPPEDCNPDAGHFVGPALVRRMTRRAYDRTVAMLLGDASAPAAEFPVETRERGYNNQAQTQHVQRVDVEAWERAARTLASSAVSDLDALLACETAERGIDACFAEFLPPFAGLALRTPLSEPDLDHYRALYDAVREDTLASLPERDPASASRRAVEVVLQALLLSPRFLFQIEEGTPAAEGLSQLTGYELAARLSFLLWNQAPDEALLASAASGRLDSAQGIAEVARGMLDDERARDVIVDFHGQWLDVSALDHMIVPDDLDESVRDSARAEVEWFVNDWFERSALVPELFTSQRARLDAPLAALYGLPPPDEPEVVELPAEQRSGLLTRAVFLGSHSIPPTRGDFVLARVLCTPVPPLAVMPPTPPALGEYQTTRQRFELHSSDPCAASCHGVLDPVGFAFEHYDASGRFRTTENGQPIDAATVLELPEETGLTGPVQDAIELSTRIASSSLAADCLAENWFRYGHGRGHAPEDACSLRAMQQALRDSGGDVRELLVAMTTSDAFRFVATQQEQP